MANELALLSYLKESFIPGNNHLKFRPGVDEIKLAQRIAAKYEYVNGQFFDKKNQQGVPMSTDSVIFSVARAEDLIEVRNNLPFNRKYSNKFSDVQMQRAREITEREVQKFLQKNGYVFKDQKFGDTTIERHILGRLKNNGFIVESSDDKNGIVFRQLKPSGYWSTKSFPVKDIIDRLTSGLLDKRQTELKRLEIEASLNEKAERLAGKYFDEKAKTYLVNEARKTQILDDLRQEYYAQSIQKKINVPEVHNLEFEFQNEFIYKNGFVAGSAEGLSLHERMQLDGYVKRKLEDLETPTFAETEDGKEYEAKLRRYDSITVDY